MEFIYIEEFFLLIVFVFGKVEGEFVGGNFFLLMFMLGMLFEIDMRGKFLFIEDIDEELY